MPIYRDQENQIITALGAAVMRQLIDLLDAQGSAGPVVPPLTNYTQPIYVADINYTKTIDGVLVTYFTTAAVKASWAVTLSLAPKYINALGGEGSTHPKDLVQFNSKEFESVIRSVKSKDVLPDLAQIRLKQPCDFFQFILATSRTMKNQYLTHDLIKSHTVQF